MDRGVWQATVHGVSRVLDTTQRLCTHTLLPLGPCSSEAPVSLLECESPESRDHTGYEHRAWYCVKGSFRFEMNEWKEQVNTWQLPQNTHKWRSFPQDINFSGLLTLFKQLNQSTYVTTGETPSLQGDFKARSENYNFCEGPRVLMRSSRRHCWLWSELILQVLLPHLWYSIAIFHTFCIRVHVC